MLRPWIILAIAGLLLTGCWGDIDPPLVSPPPGPEYLPYDSPDDLLLNLITAWQAGDIVEYADSIVYQGVLEATDGQVYQPYTFYYDRSIDPDLPELDRLAQDISRLSRMFWGLPVDGMPGIRSIQFDLGSEGDWQEVLDGEVEGEPCPAGTLTRRYGTDMLITYKSAIQSKGKITAWSIQDHAQITCIPVSVEGGIRWQLWKWRDVVDRRGESARPGAVDTSLSAVRMLY